MSANIIDEGINALEAAKKTWDAAAPKSCHPEETSNSEGGSPNKSKTANIVSEFSCVKDSNTLLDSAKDAFRRIASVLVDGEDPKWSLEKADSLTLDGKNSISRYKFVRNNTSGSSAEDADLPVQLPSNLDDNGLLFDTLLYATRSAVWQIQSLASPCTFAKSSPVAYDFCRGSLPCDIQHVFMTAVTHGLADLTFFPVDGDEPQPSKKKKAKRKQDNEEDEEEDNDDDESEKNASPQRCVAVMMIDFFSANEAKMMLTLPISATKSTLRHYRHSQAAKYGEWCIDRKAFTFSCFAAAVFNGWWDVAHLILEDIEVSARSIFGCRGLAYHDEQQGTSTIAARMNVLHLLLSSPVRGQTDIEEFETVVHRLIEIHENDMSIPRENVNLARHEWLRRAMGSLCVVKTTMKSLSKHGNDVGDMCDTEFLPEEFIFATNCEELFPPLTTKEEDLLVASTRKILPPVSSALCVKDADVDQKQLRAEIESEERDRLHNRDGAYRLVLRQNGFQQLAAAVMRPLFERKFIPRKAVTSYDGDDSCEDRWVSVWEPFIPRQLDGLVGFALAADLALRRLLPIPVAGPSTNFQRVLPVAGRTAPAGGVLKLARAGTLQRPIIACDTSEDLREAIRTFGESSTSPQKSSKKNSTEENSDSSEEAFFLMADAIAAAAVLRRQLCEAFRVPSKLNEDIIGVIAEYLASPHVIVAWRLKSPLHSVASPELALGQNASPSASTGWGVVPRFEYSADPPADAVACSLASKDVGDLQVDDSWANVSDSMIEMPINEEEDDGEFA